MTLVEKTEQTAEGFISEHFNQTSACAAFKQARHYITTPHPGEDNGKFPVAFIITFHAQIEQLERLLRSLYRPQNVYCIHVDAKVDEALMQAARLLVSCFDNVFIASRLESVIYAGVSRLEADIHCMRDLLDPKWGDWKYAVNTAASGMPLRSVAEMITVLKLYNGKNDIEGLSRARSHRFSWRWERVHTVSEGDTRPQMTNRTKSPPPHDLTIIKCSAFGAFVRPFVEFVVNDPIAKDLLEWSRDTFSPDEHYWATLHHAGVNPAIAHVPGTITTAPGNHTWLSTFVHWKDGDKNHCAGKWVRKVCVFGLDDLPLLQQQPEIMLNKFHLGFEPLALDIWELWVDYKRECAPPFDTTPYERLNWT